MEFIVENQKNIDKKMYPHVLACIANIKRGDLKIENEIKIGVMKQGLVVANIFIKSTSKGYSLMLEMVGLM